MFNDNELVVHAAQKCYPASQEKYGTFSSHLYREIYYHGRKSSECIKVGKNVIQGGLFKKILVPETVDANEELDQDVEEILDSSVGRKRIRLLVHRLVLT